MCSELKSGSAVLRGPSTIIPREELKDPSFKDTPKTLRKNPEAQKPLKRYKTEFETAFLLEQSKSFIFYLYYLRFAVFLNPLPELRLYTKFIKK